MTIRRVVRTVGVAATAPAARVVSASARAIDEAAINAHLKSIANNNRKLADLIKDNADQEASVLALMQKQKMYEYTDGVLEARVVNVLTNEKTEVDPKELFNNKHMKREDFFKVVKVQLGELKKFMAENEITAIAKKTPPKKTGVRLELKPVKVVAVTKPASRR